MHETTGIDLSNGAGIPELNRYQEHFREHKITVYHCMKSDKIVFGRRSNLPGELTYFTLMSKEIIKWSRIKSLKLQDGMFVKRVTTCEVENVCTCVTRSAAIVWRVRLAHSKDIDNTATNAIGTLEVGHFSITTRWVHQRKKCANVSDVALLVERSWRNKFSNILNDIGQNVIESET